MGKAESTSVRTQNGLDVNVYPPETRVDELLRRAKERAPHVETDGKARCDDPSGTRLCTEDRTWNAWRYFPVDVDDFRYSSVGIANFPTSPAQGKIEVPESAGGLMNGGGDGLGRDVATSVSEVLQAMRDRTAVFQEWFRHMNDRVYPLTPLPRMLLEDGNSHVVARHHGEDTDVYSILKKEGEFSLHRIERFLLDLDPSNMKFFYSWFLRYRVPVVGQGYVVARASTYEETQSWPIMVGVKGMVKINPEQTTTISSDGKGNDLVDVRFAHGTGYSLGFSNIHD